MPVVDLSAYKPVPATLGDANQIANGFTVLQTLLNGNVDNNNFGAGKIFDPTKLMQNAAIDRQAMAWDAASATWKPIGGPVYRKATAKVVANSAADTDLLNGEITIAAALIGASGIVRLSAWGDWINNTGGPQPYPRFKLKLGATTVLDTAAMGAVMSTSATRWGWRAQCEIHNLGATNSQWSNLRLDGSSANGVGNSAANFAVGEGNYGAILSAGGVGHVIATGGGASAIDTTAALVLAFSVINGSINALYDTTLKGAVVEIL